MLNDYLKSPDGVQNEFVAEPSVPDSGVQNLGVELAGGVLSRPVSPKLAHEAVLAKPPYFETPPA